MTRPIDGFISRRPTAPLRRQTPQAALPPAYTPQPRRVYALPAKPKPRRRLSERWQLILIISGALLAGLFAQSVAFGEIAIAGYGLAALIWRVPSRTTFTLAALALVATTVLLVGRGDVGLAQTFATYTFLLLVVGVITLTRELKRQGGRVYSTRQHNN